MNGKKKIIAMLLAGGQGSRLGPLTRNTAKPAIPFGGKYRIIDFSLSNCINSNINTVGVLTQYQPLELNDYLGRGEPWDMNLKYGGMHILPPYESEKNAEWFLGTADAVYQNLRFIQRYNPQHVLILSGDHIYKMDYRIMLSEHINNDAACTISVVDVPISEANRFGIMTTDSTGRIVEFHEKPKEPNSTLASMGVYLFKTEKLIQYLNEDKKDPKSDNDFGKNVIPRMLGAGERMYAYLYGGYWRDVGTFSSLWSANMDVLGEAPAMFLNDPGWKIYYRHGHTDPEFIGTDTFLSNAVVGDGGCVYGGVKDSVVFSSVVIQKNAYVSESVVMPKCIVKENAKVNYAILGENVVIGEGAWIGAPIMYGGELTVIGPNIEIPAGGVVASGRVLSSQEELQT